MLETMAANIIGMRIVPELVAECPCTTWTKSGTNMIAPNIAADCRVLAADEIVNTRLLNRRGLMTGSLARISQKKNATQAIAEKTHAPTTSHDSHG